MGSSPLTRGKPDRGEAGCAPHGLIPAHAGKTVYDDRSKRDHGAHPRSRGENILPCWPPPRPTGSSPLTRGKPLRVCAPRNNQGLIPAHAGKTVGERVTADVCEAHPRSRGENRIYTEGRTIPGGSSPLTRGKLGLANQGGPALRLIPAHAGKTRCVRPPPVLAEAHPRSRGENILSVLGGSISPGSSPLTRGKPRRVAYLAMALRLIPAHAGKTTRHAPPDSHREAHPRSRGENAVVILHLRARRGSSPLTRGKPPEDSSLARALRLIPAHAGKTGDRDGHGRRARAHPRSRGENFLGCLPGVPGMGSSPLTRGKRYGTTCLEQLERLIPAHAGKTAAEYITKRAREAHPRSRGENGRERIVRRRGQGSSPLTRGKRND